MYGVKVLCPFGVGLLLRLSTDGSAGSIDEAVKMAMNRARRNEANLWLNYCGEEEEEMLCSSAADLRTGSSPPPAE